MLKLSARHGLVLVVAEASAAGLQARPTTTASKQ
jgi:hypothetical protein